MVVIVGLIVSVANAASLKFPQAPLAFAESLDFNMHYFMSVATPRRDEDEQYDERTVPLNLFPLSDSETCYAVMKIRDRNEFLFSCSATDNDEKPKMSKLVNVDYSEEEIPPDETFVVHLTALRVLRDSGVVPKILDTLLTDERMIVTEYFGNRNLDRIRRRLTVKEVALIGAQMLQIVERIHQYGLVHGEVWNMKNWVFDTTLEGMKLTNFRKSGLFVDPVSLEHVGEDDEVDGLREGGDEDWSHEPLEGEDDEGFSVKIAKKSSRFRNSSKRRSIFAGGITTKSLSRRDDLANVAETLINWLVGDYDLFTDSYEARNSSNESVREAKRKRAKNLKNIYGNIPQIFLDFYQFCLELNFEDSVDYTKWIEALRQMGGKLSGRELVLTTVPKIGLKNVDFDLAKLFDSLKVTGDVVSAAATVLALKDDGVYAAALNGRQTFRDYMEKNRKNFTLNFSRVFARLISLVRKVHESGLVHGNITPDSFVWIGGDDETDIGGKYWRITNFENCKSFILDEAHVLPTITQIVPTTPLASLTIYQLEAYPNTSTLSRRDDAFALMELAMDSLFPSQAIGENRDEILAYKRNRRWTNSDKFGTITRMYYRSMLYDFDEAPNYEVAMSELHRRVV